MFEGRAVGIDLGAHAIKAVELRTSGRAPTVTRVARLERASLGEAGSEARGLARALRAKFAEERVSARGAILGVGGQDTLIRYARVPPAPPWRLKAIVDFEAGEIAEKIGEALAFDYRELQIPRELEDEDEEKTLLIALAKEKPLDELLDALEAEGVTVRHAVLGPLALFHAQEAFGWKPAPDIEEADELSLLADMGAENLCLALVRNGRAFFARSVSFGGRNFTAAIAEELGKDFAEAERWKLEQGGVLEKGAGVNRRLVAPLRGAADQLLGILKTFPRTSASQTRAKLPPLGRLVLLGGAMRLRGLDAYLAEGLGVSAEFFEPVGLGISASLGKDATRWITESAADFGPALGLAAAGLKSGRALAAPPESRGEPVVSVLPAKYKQRREYRERTLFLYAAAALLVLVLAIRLGHVLWRSGNASALCARLESAHAALQEKKRQFDEMERKVSVRKSRLNRLLREAELTSFQAYVLDLLARTLRPEMQLVSFGLSAAEETEDGTAIQYSVTVKCRVSDEKRLAAQWIRELQGLLEADERIASVETSSSSADGVWRTYDLSLRPSYVAY
ncbi:MAG: pilus assembly protein PilM [Planctomycetota bacterium]